MPLITNKDKRFIANSLFPSFFYSALSLFLGQIGAARMQGSWGLHVFIGAPALGLLGLIMVRARRHWPAINVVTTSPCVRASRWSLVLFAAGVLIGILVLLDSMLLLWVGIMLTYLFPWVILPLCRSRFVISSLVLLAGAVACVVVQGAPDQSLHFMVAAWIMTLPPMLLHLLVLVSLDRGYCIHEPHVNGKSSLAARVLFPNESSGR